MCALVCATQSKNLISWGDNTSGQTGQGLANGTLTVNFVATTAQFLASETVVYVSPGFSPHILTQSNKIFSMGANGNGQLAINSTLPISSNVPLQLVDANNLLAGKTISTVTSQIHSGYISCTDGSLFMFGKNLSSGAQLTTPTIQYSGYLLQGEYIKYMYSVDLSTLMITNNGTLYGYGEGSFYLFGEGVAVPRYGFPGVTAGGLKWSKVSAGYTHTIGLTTSGMVYTWGQALSGNLGQNGTLIKTPSMIDYTNLPNSIVVDIAAGQYFNVFVSSDGKGYGFGSNGFGQLCNYDIEQVYYVAVPFNQTIFGGLFITKVAAGDSFTVILTSSGQVYGCGAKRYNGLGDSVTDIDAYTSGERLTHIDSVYDVTDIFGYSSQPRATFAIATLKTTPTPSLVPTTTTQSPTTSTSATTTAAPTLVPTVIPTQAPISGPTSEPVIITLKPTVTSSIIGDATLIPQPSTNDTKILFSTNDGQTKSQIMLIPSPYSIATSSRVATATLSFEIVRIDAQVTIEIVAIDATQNVLGRVTVSASKSGILPVDVSTIFSNARRAKQIIIGGKAITFTMSVLTPNVPVSVSASTAAVSLAVVSHATPKPSVSETVQIRACISFIVCIIAMLL
jgi:alpha-tubulin suppressor-like RCC1 family protein